MRRFATEDERQAGKGQAGAEQGGPGIVDKLAADDPEPGRNPDHGHRRVAPHPVRPLHLRAGSAQHEDGAHRQRVEDPGDEDDQVEQLTKLPGEEQHARPDGARSQGDMLTSIPTVISLAPLSPNRADAIGSTGFSLAASVAPSTTPIRATLKVR